MRGILVRVLVIGVIVIGGLVFRDRISGAAADLKVGDCFDEPAGVAETVDNVQHHPCTDAHTSEIFYVGDMPDAKGAAYPGIQAVEDFADASCGAAFDAYVGTGADAATLDGGYFYPAEDGWKSGDRTVSCYVKAGDGKPLTRSLRVAAP
ncbi:MAG: septum formation family protein [Chloroflexota bacterium]